MNLLLFSKLLIVGAVCAPFLTEVEANVEGMYMYEGRFFLYKYERRLQRIDRALKSIVQTFTKSATSRITAASLQLNCADHTLFTFIETDLPIATTSLQEPVNSAPTVRRPYTLQLFTLIEISLQRPVNFAPEWPLLRGLTAFGEFIHRL